MGKKIFDKKKKNKNVALSQYLIATCPSLENICEF